MLLVLPSAVNRIDELKQQQNNNLLRIAVDSGGCNGFKYIFAIDNKVNDDDEIISHNNQQLIVVDKISLGFLANCQIEFVKELGASYFKITNPNATSTCGCGSSFAT